MKCLTYLTVAVLASFVFAGTVGAQATTTGIYDLVGDGNDVDQSGIFLSATGNANSGNVLDVIQFRADTAAAFASGTGGVLSFDTAGDGANFSNLGTIVTNYSGDSTLQLDTNGFGEPAVNVGVGPDGQSPISGGASLRLDEAFGLPFDNYNFQTFIRNVPADTSPYVLWCNAFTIKRR